jgi:hypothetical protein
MARDWRGLCSAVDCGRLMMILTHCSHRVISDITPRYPLTAGWSSGLRPRLRNQWSRVQIPVVSRGFCDEPWRYLLITAISVHIMKTEILRVKSVYCLQCDVQYLFIRRNDIMKWRITSYAKRDVQSTAQQTKYFGFCTALISRAFVQISNCKCIAWHAVERTRWS